MKTAVAQPPAQGGTLDVKEVVLSNATFGPADVERMMAGIAEDFSHFTALRDAAQQLEAKGDHTPAMKVRLGVCFYLLGRYDKAVNYLSHADGGALARFSLAKAYFAQGQYDQAIENYQTAAKAGYDKDTCTLGRAEALRYRGDARAALKELDALSGAIEQTAEYLYQRGATVAALAGKPDGGGTPQEVARLFERAVQVDPRHPGALFGLAVENDRHGNDEEAMDLYQRAVNRVPAHVGSLINLGILYEDRCEYDKAAGCYRRILEIYPDHPRARLYLKDTMASSDQIYDEDAQRKQDRLAQVLGIPVTDFELSVRSRNCLQRMGISTLGDLARVTVQQLLASKNFGETSLVEIQEMMTAKGLEIGQFAHERAPGELGLDLSTLSPDEQALLSRPVADLNLSVRARKCMIRLNIVTIGELIRKTGDELLECKNFGVTSLNEVREKLTAHGIKLRGD
jgi:DNA-directed RNA polymerase subunit alpha